VSGTRAPRAIGLGVALVSLCLLTVELALTRLFSVTIWYHFAFLAVSVALFGVGAAAILLHLSQRRLPPERTGELLTIGSLALSGTILISDLVLTAVAPGLFAADPFAGGSSAVSVAVVFLAAAAPFFVGGFAVSLAMTRYSPRVHRLYSWDLAGAAAGCALVVPALGSLGAPQTMALVAAMAALSGVPFSWGIAPGRGRLLRSLPAVVSVSLVVLASLDPLLGLFEIRRAKGMDLAEMELEYNRWNSFSMVTVVGGYAFRGWGMSPVYRGPVAEQKGLLIDMNAMTPLVRFDGDLRNVRYLAYDLASFVHLARRRRGDDVCAIGAGGGRDALAALSAGARHVTAVEINPLIVEDVVRGEYAKYTGGLYDRPDVTPVVADGRSFVRGTDETFDVILFSMVDTSAATGGGAYALTENNLFTLEAFGEYLDHLRPGGMLSICTGAMPDWNGSARIAAMAWHALKERGADPARSVAVVGAPWIDGALPGLKLHNAIIKAEPFGEGEIEAIRDGAARLAFTLEHLPGEPAGADGPDGWAHAILGAPDAEALQRLLDDLPRDVSPTTDDRPFFFYQDRLGDAWRTLTSLTRDYPWGNGLFVLVKVAAISLAMVALFLLVPFLFARGEVRAGRGGPAWDLAYVAALGLGFMCVEIGLIQKLSLHLGSPTHTLAVLLLVLLGAGAAGSRLFDAFPEGARGRMLIAALSALLALLGATWLSGLGDAILDASTSWSLAGRAALSAALVAPLGLLLGIPFPAGLRAVSARAGTRIPWLWAINSATSVMGSVAATAISMHFGIRSTIWIGAALYAAALPLSTKVARR